MVNANRRKGYEKERTLLKTFCVKRVPAFIAECQASFGLVMHAFITDGTAILRSWNTPLFTR
jgi:hypothetical protein